ncbi:extensin family protein [Jannaschia aquimarina]|uniref:Extensin-like C-terminal domain-containing protein n=1 Tax=Jannaschia aquimarina TaxID=935700 RepID=A0A0D1ECL1_9RHOB|nr:extensin family protein [Jannaschia aquimarina]KIT15459.1 hypothetical protein jaqu_28930 [Jannaschia aquimarina]SNT22082.1 Uncharacterized conserved protein [Jannaschia aquimarina]
MLRRAVRLLRLLSRLATVLLLLWVGWWLSVDPDSPLPVQWRPGTPLDVSLTETWLTPIKLRMALSSPGRCLAALSTGATYEELPPLEDGARCGIANRVAVTGIGGIPIPEVETSCPVALRLAMWARHDLRAVAEETFGSPLEEVRHQGSYNCRTIRGGNRMSYHATARAIDIRAVVIGGREIPLLGNWDGDTPESRFWRQAHARSCGRFALVLGPDFDANHADHLHLQSAGWGLCR